MLACAPQGPGSRSDAGPGTGEILRHSHDKAKPTVSLCHGPTSSIAAMPYAREFRAALIAGDPAKAAEWTKRWQYAGYKNGGMAGAASCTSPRTPVPVGMSEE